MVNSPQSILKLRIVVRYAIWYHLYNSKNTHGGVLLLVKFQASRFLNCTNDTKSRKTLQLSLEIGK